MKLFLVDIGNTNTRFGYYSEDGRIYDSGSVPTSGLTSESFPNDGSQVAVASVVPAANHVLNELFPFFVSVENASFLDFSTVDSATLGADRIANAAALAKFADTPAICVDCGTALTIEGVDKRGKFFSGPIAPGRMLLREALHSRTAKLPIVEIERHSSHPPRVFGSNTRDAILAGCDLGAIGLVRELVDRALEWPGFRNSAVIFTGGDSNFFAENIAGARNAGPDFTLLGIAAVYMDNLR